MSRITKEIAQEVSLKLTSKKLEEVVKAEITLSELLEKYLLDNIPSDVLKIFKKEPAYFDTRKSFQVMGNGFNYQYINTINQLPSKSANFHPTEEQGKQLMSLFNKKTDLRKEYNSLVNEISTLLYSLRTYSKVNTEFPEATEFLPNTITSTLTVNILDVRNKLK